MKINDSQLSSVTTTAQPAGQTGSAVGSRTGVDKKAESGDAVQLSGLSSSLQALASGGPQQEARVAGLSAEYQGGEYSVNAAAVGRQIVSETLEAR